MSEATVDLTTLTGRALDVEVARVLGCRVEASAGDFYCHCDDTAHADEWYDPDSLCGMPRVREYSTQMVSAWPLVGIINEKLGSYHSFSLSDYRHGNPQYGERPGIGWFAGWQGVGHWKGASPAEAICRVFLEASRASP